MPDFAKIIDRQITRAFDKMLAPGGLTEEVTFKFFVSDGVYDVVSDTTSAEWDDVEDINVVVAKVSYDDMKDHGAVAADMKILVPASKLPAEPEADTDKVVRADGKEWDVRKTVGVPGRALYIIYIYLT